MKNITRRYIRYALIIMGLALVVARLFFPNLLAWRQYLQFDTFSIVLLVIVGLAIAQPYFGALVKYLERIHKRWILISVCLILIVLRMIFPNAQIDTNTIWLVGIAASLFILPDIKSLIPYIKRIRIGDTELELKESIGNLEKEVEKAQDAALHEMDDLTTIPVSSDIEKVLEESSKDPRAALLLLSAKIEDQLRSSLENAGMTPSRSYPVTRYVELGVKEGIFPEEFLPAFRDFWSVRNRVAHGAAFDVDDSSILSLISLGTQLLKMASTSRKRSDQEENLGNDKIPK